MSASPTTSRSIFFVAALLAALTASCARQLPTAVNDPAVTENTSSLSRRFGEHSIVSEVAVTLAPGASAQAVADEYGATVVASSDAQRVACLLPGPGDDATSLAKRLSADLRVATSETNTYVEPAESRQKSFAFDDSHNSYENVVTQPALELVHAPQGLAVSRGDGIKVAILDTGIDPYHPLFAGRIVAARDFIENHDGAEELAYGVDTNGDGVLDGAYGHGTHVAGIVTLVAPGAKLLVGRVLDSDGIGDVATVAAGIRWAQQNGARVINLSLGTLQRSEAIDDAIEEAEEHGVVVVTSAGNWGASTPREYPASSAEAIAVAACDEDGAPTPWTSYGDYVGVTAPGVAIRSAYPGGLYKQWAGTSMSAAFVSGTAALLTAKHVSWGFDQVRNRLATTAVPFDNLTLDMEGMLGAGRLDIGDALAPDAPSGDQGSITSLGRK